MNNLTWLLPIAVGSLLGGLATILPHLWVMSETSRKRIQNDIELSHIETDRLRERNHELVSRYRKLERTHQTVLLLLAEQDLQLHNRPEVPAQPARLVLRKIK